MKKKSMDHQNTKIVQTAFLLEGIEDELLTEMEESPEEKKITGLEKVRYYRMAWISMVAIVLVLTVAVFRWNIRKTEVPVTETTTEAVDFSQTAIGSRTEMDYRAIIEGRIPDNVIVAEMTGEHIDASGGGAMVVAKIIVSQEDTGEKRNQIIYSMGPYYCTDSIIIRK